MNGPAVGSYVQTGCAGSACAAPSETGSHELTCATQPGRVRATLQKPAQQPAPLYG